MVLYGSQEFCDEYKKALNDNLKYREAASDWEGNFLWVATPGGPIEEETRMFIGLFHGECTDFKVLDPSEEVRFLKKGETPTGKGYEVEYIFTTDYETWKKLTLGQLDSVRAIMSGKAKLEGDMGKIMRSTKAAAELSATSQKMDIEWPE